MKTTAKLTAVFAAAAVTGLFAGASAQAAAAPTSNSVSRTRPTVASIAGTRAIFADATTQSSCKGQNDCKGKGGCKSDKHDCKGKNDCKGQGGCKGVII